jgi:hypothetical protein
MFFNEPLCFLIKTAEIEVVAQALLVPAFGSIAFGFRQDGHGR